MFSPPVLIAIGSIVFTLVVLGVFVLPVFVRAWGEAAVIANGVEASATIRSVEDTRARINEDPEVDIVLWVEPADTEPYEAKIRTVVSIVDLVNYRVGAKLRVKYDPEDPSKVAIEGLAPTP